MLQLRYNPPLDVEEREGNFIAHKVLSVELGHLVLDRTTPRRIS